MFRTTNFEKFLEKATSNLRLEPDWPTIIKLCDLIRQGDVQPKHALASIKKKMFSENPHTAMFGLLVLESCVKNCGNIIHDEIGTAAYMNQLRELLKATGTQDNVKNKVLELIQAWAFAFRNIPKYRAVQDTMNILKAEDYKFPALKESDAMFSADTAPEWADGDCCHRCRVQFGVVQRKHHCRACGQVFCGQCSSKSCTLPKFGIEKEVRVCDACYTNNSNVKTTKSTAPASKTEDLPAEYLNSSLAQQNQAPPPRKTEEELQEEEELQLALALSQSEAESKKTPGVSATRVKTYSPLPSTRTSSPPVEDVDPELARYLNRSYWENRPQQEEQQHSSPSAPANLSSPMPASNKSTNIVLEQNGVESEAQLEDFVAALHGQVEIFVNRMKSNSSRGRSITNDSSVQTLFMTITTMHSRLLRYIQQQDDSRVYYEGLQDKMAQVKDARAALNALREEHREKLRREAEMAERQRQLQMAQKLDIMRKKKQEYLQYQRQLALQRIQEQEREMQMRQEQQKQQYLMGSYNPMNYMPPGGYDGQGGVPGSANMGMPPQLPGYPPAPIPGGYPPQFQPGPGHPGQHIPMMNAPHPNYMMHNPMMIPPGMMVPPGPPSGQMHSMGPPPPGQPQARPQMPSIGQAPQQPQPPQQVPMGMPQVHHGPMSPNATGQASIPETNNQTVPQIMPPAPGNQNGPPIMAGAPMIMPAHGLPPQTFQPQQMQQPQPQPLPNHQPPPMQQEPKSEPPETAELISFD